jgi:uncharacterized protein (TIGR03083 family)
MTPPTRESAHRPVPVSPLGQAHLDALRSSVNRLQYLAAPLSEEQLGAGAYPTQWTIAQVLSHLGSGAVITQRRLEDALGGRDTPDDFAPTVWDTWNAKSPTAQRDDALAADATLLAHLEALGTDDRERFTTAMGPMTLDFTHFVAMRLNEHAFHTWDIEVVANPRATLPGQSAALVIDNLELVGRFTAKPTSEQRTIRIATTEPARTLIIDLQPQAVALRRVEAHDGPVDLTLPAEAFARLVYGRLDAAHTPATIREDSLLDSLRHVFPGP